MNMFNYRIQVLNDTLKCLKKLEYVMSDNTKRIIQKNHYDVGVIGTIKIDFDAIDKKFSTVTSIEDKIAQISIINEDCLEVALKYQKEGYSVAVLNMASERHVGGGYRNGACAQEESLFYRTNLSACLDYDQHSLQNQFKKYYPININEIIYTPNAVVFRHSEKLKYEYLDHYVPISFITCAAIRCETNGTWTREMKNIMRSKIHNIFKVAICTNQQVLVLGAFGCGAFRNPPNEVAKLFNEIIPIYRKYFKHIVFPIIDTYLGTSNYAIFNSIIKN